MWHLREVAREGEKSVSACLFSGGDWGIPKRLPGGWIITTYNEYIISIPPLSLNIPTPTPAPGPPLGGHEGTWEKRVVGGLAVELGVGALGFGSFGNLDFARLLDGSGLLVCCRLQTLESNTTEHGSGSVCCVRAPRLRTV